MEKTTFDFGFGPVPAHQHANGGGWVADSARVADTAYVGSKAQVSGEARVSGKAQVSGEAWVSGNAQVYGEAQVSGKAQVSGEAWVSGKAQVYGNALVCDNAQVYGEAQVSGEAWVSGNAQVYGEAQVTTTPLVITGLEYAVTVCDNQVQIGCKTVPAATQLSADLFPDETCPVLRACAHTLIPLIQGHYARATQGACQSAHDRDP